MANVSIQPVPASYRAIPRWLWPQHPPIFDGQPTEADWDLARELWAALDPESQGWYRNIPRLGAPL